MKSRKRSRMDTAIRRAVLEASPHVSFDEGTDTLLRLGCFLFLERVASEAHEAARLEGKKTEVNGEDVRKAVKTVISDIRQF